MIDSHISDNVFKDDLEVALKGQGLKIADRKRVIAYAMNEPKEKRNAMLDNAEQVAREHQAAKKASKKVRSEFEEHTDFIFKIKKMYPYLIPIYIHNGGSRSPREKVDQMRLGLCPGASDVFFPQIFTWVEMKKTKNYEQSEVQKSFEQMVLNAGYSYILGIGCDDAIKKLEEVIKNKL
jgi:hypothetical protein